MKRKMIIGIILVILLFTTYSIYSRPKTLLDLYPMLTLDKCVEITGYYRVGEQEEESRFVIEKDSEEFQDLFSHFYWKTYRRSLKDILPRGTRTHRATPDDFQWNVYFTFEPVEFPDGNSCSGMLLHFKNWYGDLDIYFTGERYSCYTNDQEVWLSEVLEIIQKGFVE